MNQDSDKEIDILLQRQARGGASSPSGQVEGTSSTNLARGTGATHMDADELSAYAEGALPERARSRYAAHLADCDSCRRIVTELVIASNIEAEESGPVAQTVVEPRRNWRAWLAGLFSPPVLRFAVPALALAVITAVVLIVATRRSNEETNLVAENRQVSEQPASSSANDRNKESSASSNVSTANSERQSSTATANAGAVDAKPDAGLTPQPDTRAAEPPVPPREDGAVTLPIPKSTEAPSNGPPSTDQERKAEAPPAQPVMTNTPADKVLDRAKEKDETLAAQKQRNEEAAGGAVSATSAGAANGRRNRSTEDASKSTVGAASETADDARESNRAAKSAPAARTKRDAAGADVDSTSSSTRTVAGKSFRQQNGVWVDKAYKSSLSLVNVKRGTEQYRALVADEPIIATVSNELGNCIVVVKGRAYHVY